jgi:hypothetical protein
MANKEHLAPLKEAIEKKDIEIWNKWRQENPDIRSDLSGADLHLAQPSYVRGLVPSQIKSAVNWEVAFYSQEILVSLGLPPDHNEELRRKPKIRALEEKQPEE